jgi:uncharacterized membrane-anchored protein
MSAIVVRVLIAMGALLVFGSVNYSIYAKERVIRDGEVIYLQLGSVDPRSLMQGDYMALRFLLASQLERSRHATDDLMSLQLDSRRVASIAAPDSTDTLRMHYRMRDGHVWLGTNAYFFKEGSGAHFAPARYGKFRVDRRTGEAVLVGLCDDQLQDL